MILLTSSFCPSVAFVSLFAAKGGGEVVIEESERYVKQTLRNRALFMTASGPQAFTIPVKRYGYPAPPLSEILISEHGDWRHKLEHMLRSGYGTAPFWEHYEESLRELIFDETKRSLAEYNRLWLEWLLKQWDLPLPLGREEIPGESVRRFESEELAEVPLGRYWQVFEGREGFKSGLSALDLLLCEGPYAIGYLRRTGISILRSV